METETLFDGPVFILVTKPVDGLATWDDVPRDFVVVRSRLDPDQRSIVVFLEKDSAETAASKDMLRTAVNRPVVGTFLQPSKFAEFLEYAKTLGIGHISIGPRPDTGKMITFSSDLVIPQLKGVEEW